MDTLFEMKTHAGEQNEEKDVSSANNTEVNKKPHSSTFDLVPVLTITRMRKTIKDQIKEQFNKITG